MRKKVTIFLFFLVLFLITGYLLTYKNTSSNFLSPLTDGLKLNDTIENRKTVTNPLTGVTYSEEDSSSWLTERPLGVMINNHLDARMQSGLLSADIVYEIVAEGGITRFLAFFLSETPEKIGPIRSTRTYYLTIVKELGDAMLMHEGYSPQALAAIESWPVRSLQRGGASGVANWREPRGDVAYEHTLYTNGALLREHSKSLGWEGTREFLTYKFKDDTPFVPKEGTCGVGACKNIEIDFWYKGDYSAIWKYDPPTNMYLRFTGYDSAGEPVPHLDNETKKQIQVKNLVVQFVEESAIDGDDKNRLDYDLIGSGSGLVFYDGGVKNITWRKADRDERTLFFDEQGVEIEFNRGKFWISIVPSRNSAYVVY